jgi:hypothetical protein
VPIPEYRFAPPRKWRWDWAFVEAKVAIEQQGGLFSGGRHVRGPALLKEMEKLNAGACNGWRVLYCTPQEFASGAILESVEKCLAQRGV